MTTQNEYLENTFPQIKTNEVFKKWISAKQVNFFVSVLKLTDSNKLKNDGVERKFFVGNTDKYDVAIYISPLNQAGSIKITNMENVQNTINIENNEALIKLNKELDELSILLNSLQNEPEKFTQKEIEVSIPYVQREIKNLEFQIKNL